MLGPVTLPKTVAGVVDRMRAIDATLPATDGVAVFNRMYLTVTETIDGLLRSGGPAFHDPGLMADLDVRFAGLWLAAYDAPAGRRARCWRPLFEARYDGRQPLQYALAGMNAHIEHDLPLAVVDTCRAHRRSVEDPAVHADFLAVNAVLAQVEADVRRSLLDDLAREADELVGPVVHLASCWNIERARDIAWVTAETLYSLRHLEVLRAAHLEALDRTVGMTSRILLTPLT